MKEMLLHRVWLALLLTIAAPICVAQGPGQLPITRYATPVYPDAERHAGHEGMVTLLAQVRKNGRVQGVELQTSCGFPALDESALAAARRMRFEPARDGAGRRVDGTSIVKIFFALQAPPGEFMQQRCLDLLHELHQASGGNRTVKLSDSRTFVATTAVLTKMSATGSLESQRRFREMLPRVYELTAERCGKSPLARYEDVLGTAITDAGAELKNARSGTDP
jgi:periplasmic protein TonB